MIEEKRIGRDFKLVIHSCRLRRHNEPARAYRPPTIRGTNFEEIFDPTTYRYATIRGKIASINSLAEFLYYERKGERDLWSFNLDDVLAWGSDLVMKGWASKSLTNYLGTAIQWTRSRYSSPIAEDDYKAFFIKYKGLKRQSDRDDPKSAKIPSFSRYQKLSPKAQGIYNFQTSTGIRLQSLACFRGDELIKQTDELRVYNLSHLKTAYKGGEVAAICRCYCSCSSNPLQTQLCPLHCKEPISFPIDTKAYVRELGLAEISSHSARRLMACTLRHMVESKIIPWRSETAVRDRILEQFLWKKRVRNKSMFHHYSRDYEVYDPINIPPFQYVALRVFNISF